MTKEALQDIISEVISLLQNQIHLLQSDDAVNRNDIGAVKVDMAEVKANLRNIEQRIEYFIDYINKQEAIDKDGSYKKTVAYITGILGLLTGAIAAWLARK